MKISKDAKRIARRLFRSCFKDEMFDETMAREVVDRVASEKPRHTLAILTVFARLARLETARSTAYVESAVELGVDSRGDVERRLQSLYRRRLAVVYRVNPGLIGGARIAVGSDVWDGSIKNRLETLRTAI